MTSISYILVSCKPLYILYTFLQVAKFFLTICITIVCYFDGVMSNIQFSIQVQAFLANCFRIAIDMNFCDGHGFVDVIMRIKEPKITAIIFAPSKMVGQPL